MQVKVWVSHAEIQVESLVMDKAWVQDSITSRVIIIYVYD